MEAVLDKTMIEDIDIEQIDNEIEEDLKNKLTVAIQTEVLQKLVGKVENAVARRAVQDVYKMIYLEFQEDQIIARAINNDYIAQAVVKQNEDQTNYKLIKGKPTSLCFPSDKLTGIVKRLRAKNSQITINDLEVQIKSGRPEFKILCIEGSEFPRTPVLGESKTCIKIHAGVLSDLYARTIYATSDSETRPVLTGVNHRIKNNQLICVATDSYRLAQYKYELTGEYEDITVTIPANLLKEAKKHLDAYDDEIVFHLYEERVVYEIGNITLYGRVLEGKYPDTDRLIFDKDQAGSSFTISAGKIKEALNNAAVYGYDTPMTIRIKPELGQMRLSKREVEVGEYQEDLVIHNGTGQDVILGLNIRYLQDAFSNYGNDEIIQFLFLPSANDTSAGLRPFRTILANGDPDSTDLCLPVRMVDLDYSQPVEIENFEGTMELNFDPFEEDFAEISE